MKEININPPSNSLTAASLVMSDEVKKAEKVVEEGANSAHVARSGTALDVTGVPLTDQFPDLPFLHEAVSDEEWVGNMADECTEGDDESEVISVGRLF